MGMNINQALAECIKKMQAVGKNSHNAEQRFNYRSIDDVYAEVHQHFKDVGIVCLPKVQNIQRESLPTKSGGLKHCSILTVLYTFIAPDGSSLECTVLGEAMDSGDKSINKAMAAAHKYALCQMFCLPTGEAKDPDGENHNDLAGRAGQAARPGPGNTGGQKAAPPPKQEPRASADELARLDVLLLKEGLKTNSERLGRINKWLAAGSKKPVGSPAELAASLAALLIRQLEQKQATPSPVSGKTASPSQNAKSEQQNPSPAKTQGEPAATKKAPAKAPKKAAAKPDKKE